MHFLSCCFAKLGLRVRPGQNILVPHHQILAKSAPPKVRNRKTAIQRHPVAQVVGPVTKGLALSASTCCSRIHCLKYMRFWTTEILLKVRPISSKRHCRHTKPSVTVPSRTHLTAALSSSCFPVYRPAKYKYSNFPDIQEHFKFPCLKEKVSTLNIFF